VLLTACQKTPERNIVMPKRPIVSQQEKGNIAPQPTAYEVESHISEEFIYDNKDFTVEIDADISIPDVKEFCI
jgi:hypothetical protein